MDGGDPQRPATPRLRSPLARWWRPAAPGYAALAIATGPMVATRSARLRRACDRHWPDGGDPQRPATPRLRSPLDGCGPTEMLEDQRGLRARDIGVGIEVLDDEGTQVLG